MIQVNDGLILVLALFTLIGWLAWLAFRDGERYTQWLTLHSPRAAEDVDEDDEEWTEEDRASLAQAFRKELSKRPTVRNAGTAFADGSVGFLGGITEFDLADIALDWFTNGEDIGGSGWGAD